jgi:flagellar motor protein MotB
MFRRRQIPKKAGEGENPFLLTFSDFMASLLAIFILVLIVTLIELDKKKKILNVQQAEMSVKRDKLRASLKDIEKIQQRISGTLRGVSDREQVLKGILEGIKERLANLASPITIEIVENDTVLRIPSGKLVFETNKFSIQNTKTANEIGEALLHALSEEKNRSILDTVFIEGHTDSKAKGDEMGNWGLSAYRAISLWNLWTENDGPLSELKRLRSADNSKWLIAVSGYADRRPTSRILDQQALDARPDRPEDRRIDIRFTLMSAEKQSLEGLQGNMKEVEEKMKALILELEPKPPVYAP